MTYVKLLTTGKVYRESEYIPETHRYFMSTQHSIEVDSLGNICRIYVGSSDYGFPSVRYETEPKEYELVDDSKFHIQVSTNHEKEIYRKENIHYPFTTYSAVDRYMEPTHLWNGNLTQIFSFPGSKETVIYTEYFCIYVDGCHITSLDISVRRSTRLEGSLPNFSIELTTGDKRISEYLTILGVPHVCQ